MLSSIGRAAIRRIGAGGQSTKGALLRISRVDTNQQASRSQAQFFLSIDRTYATAAAVKTASKKSATTATPTKDTKAKTITKTTKSAAKAPAKKTATKAEAKPVKKVASTPKKPAVAKKPTRKGLTDRQKAAKANKALKLQAQKARAAVRKQKANAKLTATKERKKGLAVARKEKALAAKPKLELRELKAAALKLPAMKPRSAYSLYIRQSIVGVGNAGNGPLAEAAAKYKTISAEEKETLDRTTVQNRADNQIILAKWVESHTPDQILEANKARTRLRKLTGQKSNWPKIDDARIPTKNLSGWTIFTKEQFHEPTEDKPTDFLRSIAAKWKSMSEAERKPYLDASEVDKDRYMQEYKTVFHRDPPSVANASATATA